MEYLQGLQEYLPDSVQGAYDVLASGARQAAAGAQQVVAGLANHTADLTDKVILAVNGSAPNGSADGGEVAGGTVEHVISFPKDPVLDFCAFAIFTGLLVWGVTAGASRYLGKDDKKEK